MKLRSLFRSWVGSALLLLPALASAAQTQAVDSLSQNARARRAQEEFERLRAAHAPLHQGGGAGGCDEVVGRFCLRYLSGLPEDWTPPEEDPRVVSGREDLLSLLEELGDSLPGDQWILGQRIAYLGEISEWERAHEIALGCRPSGWWCSAYRGTTLHFLGAIEEAEAAFAQARREMSEEQLREWEDIRPLLEFPLVDRLAELSADSLELLHSRIWRLADPLFLLSGNDVRSAHDARQTLASIRAEGENAYGLSWGEDLHEIFVRYGPEVAYQQAEAPRPGVYPIPLVGRFDPLARGFFPTAAQLGSPADITLGSWRTDERSVRSRYTPVGAERVGALEVQQARFRRGDDHLLVLGWRVSGADLPWSMEDDGESDADPGDGAADPNTPPEGALFLLPLYEEWDLDAGRNAVAIEFGDDGSPAGILAAPAPSGSFLVSLELHDPPRSRGWRARHGVRLLPLPEGVPGLSDLLLLAPDEPQEEASPFQPSDEDSLALHLARVLPSLRIEGDSVEVAWESYGTGADAGAARYTLSVSPEGEGTLRRVLEFLRISRPRAAAEISWEEVPGTREVPGTPNFRRVTLDLSDFPPGRGKIRLQMQLPGREEMVSEVFFEKTTSPR